MERHTLSSDKGPWRRQSSCEELPNYSGLLDTHGYSRVVPSNVHLRSSVNCCLMRQLGAALAELRSHQLTLPSKAPSTRSNRTRTPKGQATPTTPAKCKVPAAYALTGCILRPKQVVPLARVPSNQHSIGSLAGHHGMGALCADLALALVSLSSMWSRPQAESSQRAVIFVHTRDQVYRECAEKKPHARHDCDRARTFADGWLHGAMFRNARITCSVSPGARVARNPATSAGHGALGDVFTTDSNRSWGACATTSKNEARESGHVLVRLRVFQRFV